MGRHFKNHQYRVAKVLPKQKDVALTTVLVTTQWLSAKYRSVGSSTEQALSHVFSSSCWDNVPCSFISMGFVPLDGRFSFKSIHSISHSVVLPIVTCDKPPKNEVPDLEKNRENAFMLATSLTTVCKVGACQFWERKDSYFVPFCWAELHYWGTSSVVVASDN